MEIYFYIYFSLLFLALKEKRVKENYKKVSLVFILLAVFLAIRYQVGNDYAEYHNSFQNLTYDAYFEPGFIFLYKIFNSPEVFFALLSCFSLFLLYKAFKYFSEGYLYISLLVYYSAFFIIFNIHLIRQSVAIAIVLFSFTYLHKKKYLKFFILVLLATNFHKSALIAIPFSLIVIVKLNKKTRLLILGFAILSYIIFTFFRNEVFMLLYYFPVTNRFATVYNNLTYSSGYGISIGLLFDIVLFIFVNSRKNLSDKQLFLLNIFLCSIFINIAFNNFSVALRLGYYFRIVSIFLFVNLIKIRPKFIFYIFLIIYSGYYLNNNLFKGHAVLEYKTIFNKK